MKKVFLIVIALLLIGGNALKAAVYVDSVIVASDGKRKIAYSLPDDYNSAKEYKMLLCIQPCNGTTYKKYLEAFKLLTDSLDMIVACPDMGASGGWFSNTNSDIITVSIDSAASLFNIDKNSVYFTGMSCNGEVALRQGLKKIYPFKGIFPWAPYNPVAKTTDLNSDVPVIISVGTKDEMSYTAILNIYDSLKTHGAKVNLVLVPGITHTYEFATFANEMMHCMQYLNDSDLISIKYAETSLPIFDMMDNDAEKELTFNVKDKYSKELVISSLSSNVLVIDNPTLTYNAADGTVKLKFKPIAGKAGNIVIVLEAKEKNGAAIEQFTFKVKVTKQVVANAVSTNKIASGIQVYPNPASEKLFINSNEEKLDIQIFDLNGKLVLKQAYYKDNVINIAGFKSGIYFLSATGKNNTTNVKFSVK